MNEFAELPRNCWWCYWARSGWCWKTWQINKGWPNPILGEGRAAMGCGDYLFSAARLGEDIARRCNVEELSELMARIMEK